MNQHWYSENDMRVQGMFDQEHVSALTNNPRVFLLVGLGGLLGWGLAKYGLGAKWAMWGAGVGAGVAVLSGLKVLSDISGMKNQ